MAQSKQLPYCILRNNYDFTYRCHVFEICCASFCLHFLNVDCSREDRVCSEAERSCKWRCNGLKLYYWMQFVNENYPKVKFLTKIDDDLLGV